MSADKVFGIDLGTTYSAVAHENEFGQPEIIQNLDGQQTTPSVVYFESANNFIVGQEAKNGLQVNPDDSISLIKRKMGEKHTLEFHGKSFTPESISALILRQLAETAQEMTGSDSKKVVITVPAYFGLVEKEATRQAGEIAGLNVVGILAEPIAAALSAGVKPGVTQTVLVYDLGGGTFDCTVMKLTDEAVEVLAVDGDRRLGGADWDKILYDLALQKFMDQAGLNEDPSYDVEFAQGLMNSVEEAKKSLTLKKSTKIRCSHGEAKEMVEISREEFEQHAKTLVDRTMSVVDRTIKAAEQKSPELNIDKFLLVGGASRMPMIQDRLKTDKGWDLTLTEFDLAVAKGAAIYGQGAMDFQATNAADSHADQPRFQIAGSNNSNGMIIRNLLSKSVGVKFFDPDKNEEYVGHLLDQGQELPAESATTAYCAQDGTTRIEVHLYEQDGEVPSRSIGANKEITPEDGAAFEDLPNLSKGSPLEMRMKVDSEGLLEFSGFEPSTNQTVELKVTVSTLQPDEVEAAKTQVGLMVREE